MNKTISLIPEPFRDFDVLVDMREFFGLFNFLELDKPEWERKRYKETEENKVLEDIRLAIQAFRFHSSHFRKFKNLNDAPLSVQLGVMLENDERIKRLSRDLRRPPEEILELFKRSLNDFGEDRVNLKKILLRDLLSHLGVRMVTDSLKGLKVRVANLSAPWGNRTDFILVNKSKDTISYIEIKSTWKAMSTWDGFIKMRDDKNKAVDLGVRYTFSPIWPSRFYDEERWFASLPFGDRENFTKYLNTLNRENGVNVRKIKMDYDSFSSPNREHSDVLKCYNQKIKTIGDFILNLYNKYNGRCAEV